MTFGLEFTGHVEKAPEGDAELTTVSDAFANGWSLVSGPGGTGTEQFGYALRVHIDDDTVGTITLTESDIHEMSHEIARRKVQWA